MAAPGGRIPRRFTLPRRYHRALQITALPEWARTQGVPGGPAVGSEHRPRLSTPADNQRHFFADGRATQATRQAPGAAPVTGLERPRWPKVHSAVALRAFRVWLSVAPSCQRERELQRSYSSPGPGCWAVDLVAGDGSAVTG